MMMVYKNNVGCVYKDSIDFSKISLVFVVILSLFSKKFKFSEIFINNEDIFQRKIVEYTKVALRSGQIHNLFPCGFGLAVKGKNSKTQNIKNYNFWKLKKILFLTNGDILVRNRISNYKMSILKNLFLLKHRLDWVLTLFF
jgi:hypothetical protein